MVNKTMKELQVHGTPNFPIAFYEWYGDITNNMQLKCHWHPEWEFFTITEGRVSFSVNGERAEMGVGDIAFVRGGQLHFSEAIDNKPFRYRALVFSPSMLHLLPDEALEAKYIRPLLDGGYRLPMTLTRTFAGNAPLEAFNRTYNALCDKPLFYELSCKAGLIESLACWLKHAEPTGDEVKITPSENIEKMKTVLNYIHKNYSNYISVSLLSKEVNMSEGYFTRVFQRCTSNSPMDYVIKLRLAKASELLRDTDLRIIDIATNSGFNNLSYFVRTFQARFSCSPTCYRKEHKIMRDVNFN